VGLRSLLNRQAAAARPIEPLARLAKLGRMEEPDEREGDRASSDPHPHRPPPFAEQATRDRTAPSSPVAVGKKRSELVPELAVESSAVESKKTEPRRVAYVWRSQASRERRSQAVDFGNTRF
jgi:hypothetical protein